MRLFCYQTKEKACFQGKEKILEPIIQIDLKTLRFPGESTPALRDIKLNIQEGEMIAITGDVASGKSLLLHTITSAVPKFFPASLAGSINIRGRDIKSIPLPQMSDDLGYMMQEPQNQMVNRKIWDELAFGVSNMNLSPKEIDDRVNEVTDFLSLRGFLNQTTDALSGGQAQKVILGSILAMKTPILLLDQPTAELDPKTSYELYRYLGQINRDNNITIIVVMDKGEEAIKYADRIILMENGTIKELLSVKEYKKRDNNQQKQNKSFINIDRNINMVQLLGVSHQYKGGVTGCHPIDFTLKKGEFAAIIGQNGSGKTTMIKLIEGLLKPTTGKMELFGEEVNKKNIGRLRRKIGFLFQNPDDQIFLNTVKEELTYVFKNETIREDEKNKRVVDTLALIGLSGFEEMHPQKLSRGQRQLLALGSIIISDVKLIIADEPTSGLNKEQSFLVMDKLRVLAEQGITILLVTHHLAEAKDYANRILVMHEQRLIHNFKATQLGDYFEKLVKIKLLEGENPYV